MLKIIPDLNKIKISDLLRTHKCDFIFQFQKQDHIQKTIGITRKQIRRFIKLYEEKLIYINDLIQFCLSLDTPITLTKIYKHPHNKYKLEDYKAQILNTKKYYPSNEDPIVLYYIKIENLRTKVILEDWIKPNQLDSIKAINQMIEWDIIGEELTNFKN